MAMPVPSSPISVAERSRRQEAVDFARHNVGLEGFTLTPEAEVLFARFVKGDLTEDELNAAVLKLAHAPL